MLCENCGSKQAVMKYYENINGEKKTKHLCEECADKIMGSCLSFGGTNPFDVFQHMMGAHSLGSIAANQCPTCGTTLADFAQYGKLGCCDCYDVFEDPLEQVFRRVQYGLKHTGKQLAEKADTPKLHRDCETITDKESPVKQKQNSEIPPDKVTLQNQIQAAVKKEDYETAAKLKKKLDALEDGK